MSDTTSTADERAIDALTRIMESAISPEMLEAQQIILRRLALSGDLFPSRVPPPRNITEVGGYLNLIADDPILRAQVLASALGVAGPNPAPGWEPVLPALYYASRANDRPPGSAQPSTPVQIGVRSDFVGAFDGARATIHGLGATIPVLAMSGLLPPATPGAGEAPPDHLLPYLGRTLDLVPSAALVAPATDALAVGQLGGAGPQLVVARQLDPGAPNAAAVPTAAWSMWTCDAATCTQSTVSAAFVDLAPILNGAGWYQPTPLAAPTSLAAPGGWNHWTNITALVPGVTRFGDELRLLHPMGVIAASSVRERLDWVWDGTMFAAPA